MQGAAPGAVSVLGFDVGSKRIGVAVGNTLTGTARTLAVLDVRDGVPDWTAFDRLVREWQPGHLIVGEPLMLDGTAQPATRAARRFAHAIRERTGLPVALVDERSSSREADRRFADHRQRGLARRQDAASLDAWAAQVILERWLQSAG